MIHKVYPIQVEGSQSYARLTVYIQEHYEEVGIDDRPMVLICPGGAYAYTSPREGEAYAMQFLSFGYHAAVLNYSCAPSVYPAALTELALSVALIRSRAREWHVAPRQVIVMGSSAGGHLAASLGVFWQEAFLGEAVERQFPGCAAVWEEGGVASRPYPGNPAPDQSGLQGFSQEMLRPDGMILCYPVITSGEFAHRGSFENLLGEREAELTEAMSLENRVSDKTPPTFLWHTFEDNAVPVENSLLFVGALRRAGVSTEFHLYPRGGHGLALANRLTASRDGGAMQEECTSWISLAHTWVESRYVKGLQG